MPFALPGFFRTLGFDFSSAFLYIDPDDSADLASVLAGTYDFTTVGAITGTIVVATEEGTYSAGISLDAATTYDLYSQGVNTAHYGFLDTPVGYAIFPSALSEGDIARAEAALVAEGAAPRSAFGSVTSFFRLYRNCASLTSFPLLDTSSATTLREAWQDCSGVTTFPLIDTSLVEDFRTAWRSCSSLTSFPLINTSSGTDFSNAWRSCSSLTSFPLIDTSSGGNFLGAWYGCSSLASFPQINTSQATDFGLSWYNCSSLTTFPLINASFVTSFQSAWRGCNSLTSFPAINTSSGTNFSNAWMSCDSLTSFPANFFDNWSPASVSSGVFNLTWDGCVSLTNTSVENILTSLDTSGIYGTNTGLSSGTQLADHTIDIDYDGTTLSSATITAIANLQSKDWAININNVLQHDVYGTSISGTASGSNVLYNGVAPAVSGESYRVRFTASNVNPRGRVRYRNYAGGADIAPTSGLGSLVYFETDGDYESIVPADNGLSIWIYSESGQSWDYSGFSVQQI